MSIDVTTLDESDRDVWNRCVEQSDQTNLFHQYEALSLLVAHSGATLHPLIGYNGQEPVGIMPVFEVERGRRRIVKCPPYLLESFSLGPALLNLAGTKRRRAERHQRQFVEGCLEYVEEDIAPAETHVRLGGRFTDVRPFLWNGYEASPYYTYVVDLTPGREAVMAEFSRDARSNIRKTDTEDVEVYEGGVEEIRAIVEQVQDRHDEQGKEYRVYPGFVIDLYEALPEGQVRPYVLEHGGELACGMITLEYGDTIYRWEGGAKYGGDVPAADLLDWHIMCEAMDRDVARYDLVGANMPRLCTYKAKFGPEPEVYYNIERKAPLDAFTEGARALAADVLDRADDLRTRVK
ncbi:lipid II:glycine glycyltransferase FemX [Halomarina ordinaria]|uniref:Lipid II:glycine glycyltransferase FemX n=1 Tax=Halomarina ordinaria TaxID=3033939 RepID=A0ABD5UDB8_9EURY|nr:GNAT family N-acetyltransferase [Halomarina sp. PSRA2]